MAYGNRSYGQARYGLSASLTFFRTYNETIGLNAFRKEEYSLNEALVVDVDRVFTPSPTYTDELLVSEGFERVFEGERNPVEEMFLDGNIIRSSESERLYNETVMVEDRSSRTIDLIKSEDFVLDETYSKDIEIFRGESLVLDTEAFRSVVLERDYSEEVFLNDFHVFEVGLVRDESLALDDLRPVFGVFFDESIVLDDSTYRLRSIIDVDIPGLYSDIFEKHDIIQRSTDIEMEVVLTESSEDSPGPYL